MGGKKIMRVKLQNASSHRKNFVIMVSPAELNELSHVFLSLRKTKNLLLTKSNAVLINGRLNGKFTRLDISFPLATSKEEVLSFISQHPKLNVHMPKFEKVVY